MNLNHSNSRGRTRPSRERADLDTLRRVIGGAKIRQDQLVGPLIQAKALAKLGRLL